jgi:glutamyl-tRNA synthetase
MVYEHGRAIAERIGLTITQDTFNPVVVDFYRQVGYLPHAVVNYLLLLGWSLDDKTEFFTRQQMIEVFSLERVNKAPASFDPQKLLAFQAHYMQQEPLSAKEGMTLPYLEKAGLVPAPASKEATARLRRVLEAAGDRIKVAGDVLDYAAFFQADDALTYDEAAFDKRLRQPPQAAELLRGFQDRLAAVEPFDAPTLEKALQDYVQARGIKADQVVHAVRVAVTGRPVGFGLFDALAILGKPSCLARIDRALARLGG